MLISNCKIFPTIDRRRSVSGKQEADRQKKVGTGAPDRERKSVNVRADEYPENRFRMGPAYPGKEVFVQEMGG